MATMSDDDQFQCGGDVGGSSSTSSAPHSDIVPGRKVPSVPGMDTVRGVELSQWDEAWIPGGHVTDQ